MDYKDYYKILGIERKANEDEIKRAYRKLAMKFHPDRNPGDKKAEDQFKEINEAYQVLSDPQKRARYDQLGESYSRYQQRGGAPGGFNWEDWFVQRAPAGGNVQYDVGNLEDLFGGGLGGGFSEFFSRIFGGAPNMGGGARRGPAQAQAARPSLQYEAEISLYEAFNGTTRKIEIDGRRLEVKIPAGVRTGSKVRVSDAVVSPDERQKGDLFINIRVLDDPKFERKGDDLHTEVAVDLYTAVLGGEVKVPTLSGDIVLTIPAGTQSAQTFRLGGRGMPRLKSPDGHGDLMVRVKVNIPRRLTPKQRELFEQLAAAK